MSGRSCWSRASRGEPCPVESHPTPSAGSVACLGTLRVGRLPVTSSWQPAAAGRALPGVRFRRRGPEPSPASTCVAGSRRSCEPHGRPWPRSEHREVLDVEGGRGGLVRAVIMDRWEVRKTHRGWQWSCPLPRLAGGGSLATATRPLKLGCRGTGAAWRPCRPSCPGIRKPCPPLLGPAARLSPAWCLVATLHGAATCSSSADGGRISHDQHREFRTTRAETIAATAACCGRSVAELQGRFFLLGWESKPTPLRAGRHVCRPNQGLSDSPNTPSMVLGALCHAWRRQEGRFSADR